MLAKEWIRFESTGCIKDYLDYSSKVTCEKRETANNLKSKEQESENRDGADHYAYRYGTGSNPHRGI